MLESKRNTTYKFLLFLFQFIFIILLLIAFVVFFNYSIDASHVINAKTHKAMAKLALAGNVVAVPENYNERIFQLAIIENMRIIPETIVVGSSRGMFLGKDITGYTNLYNHCVSGACIEDYYAILGLYFQKYKKMPSRVIIEISPWIFYEHNIETRWLENYSYRSACERFYKTINGKNIEKEGKKKENPYFSISYFQYNFSYLKENGIKSFLSSPARISNDDSEAADNPDGTIRYKAILEKAGLGRLAKVQAYRGAVVNQGVHRMKEIDSKKKLDFENLIYYLLKNNVEIIIYLEPFSVTQCRFSFDNNMNPIFRTVEKYCRDFSKANNLKFIGGYDARKYNISDNSFINSMHLDKTGTAVVWSTDYNKITQDFN